MRARFDARAHHPTDPPRAHGPAERSRPTRSGAAILLLTTVLGGWSGLAGAARAADAPFDTGTAFWYDVVLQREGHPAEGRFDLAFELWSDDQAGELLGRVDHAQVPVATGSIRARLDFGADVLGSDERWIQLHVRPPGEGSFVAVGPRRRVTGRAGGVCAVDDDLEINGTLSVQAPGDTPEIHLLDGQLRLAGTLLGGLHFDAGGMQAASGLGSPTSLFLNPDGGGVGLGVLATTAPLTVPGGPDASPGSGGAMVLGPLNGPNVAIDDNEIMGRNAGATSALTLNAQGGDVVIGGRLDIGLVVDVVTAASDTIDVACSVPGTRLLAGGCRGGSILTGIRAAYPLGPTTWRCVFEQTEPDNEGTAICARLHW